MWHSTCSLGWPFSMLKYINIISNKIYGSNLARLKEIGTRWNQRCLYIPTFFRGHSFTSVFIFVPSWYALTCIVKFNIFEIKFNFEKWWGWSLGRGIAPLPSIMKFKNACISTKSKTFYPHEQCRTYVNKTIFVQKWRHSLRNNHYRASVFPIGTNFVQVSQ